jgi:hypothetical protein
VKFRSAKVLSKGRWSPVVYGDSSAGLPGMRSRIKICTNLLQEKIWFTRLRCRPHAPPSGESRAGMRRQYVKAHQQTGSAQESATQALCRVGN